MVNKNPRGIRVKMQKDYVLGRTSKGSGRAELIRTPGGPASNAAVGAAVAGLAALIDALTARQVFGPQGDDGIDGDPGPPGLPGATGATGATGAAGAQGAQGIPGQDGTDGDDGGYPLVTTSLLGDVTGSGIGPITTTIAANAVTTAKINNGAVTYAKIQNESASTLLGNPTGGAAAPSEVTLGAGLSFSGGALVANVSGASTGGALSLIGTKTPTSGNSTTFLSIPQTFTNLMLIAYCKSDGTGLGIRLNITFNGDSGSNYDRVELQSINGGASNNAAAAAAFISAGYLADASNTNEMGYMVMTIMNYANATRWKVVDYKGGMQNSTASSTFIVSSGYGNWRSTAAIGNLTCTVSTGNFSSSANSIELYGIA